MAKRADGEVLAMKVKLETAPRRGPQGYVVDFAILLKDAGVRWFDDNCLRLGASLAYYAVFSIFPLLLLAVTGVGFFLGHDPETRAHLLALATSASSPGFKTVFDETLRNMQAHETARGVGAVIGVVTLFVSTSAAFSELETTLNQIWRVKMPSANGIWATVLRAVKDKALSFAVVIGAAVALLASLLVSAALSAVDQTVEGLAPGAATHATLWIVAEAVGSVGILSLALATMFRLLPQTDVKWSDVFGGALLTGLLLTGTKRVLVWYLGHLGSYAAYGAIGGFLGLLTWIYLASLFIFYGAEFTRVYAERYGSLAQRASPTLDQSSHRVNDDAGDASSRPKSHLFSPAPVGAKRRDDERDKATEPRGAPTQADGERHMARERAREGEDDHAKENPILHG
jgi:membrane protein